MNNIDELRARLIAEVTAARAEGWTITHGKLFTESKECCLLGACVRDRKRTVNNTLYFEAYDRLKLDRTLGLQLALGFDASMHGWTRAPNRGELYQLGYEL